MIITGRHLDDVEGVPVPHAVSQAGDVHLDGPVLVRHRACDAGLGDRGRIRPAERRGAGCHRYARSFRHRLGDRVQRRGRGRDGGDSPSNVKRYVWCRVRLAGVTARRGDAGPDDDGVVRGVPRRDAVKERPVRSLSIDELNADGEEERRRDERECVVAHGVARRARARSGETRAGRTRSGARCADGVAKVRTRES